jgi:hypothetical protein
MRVFRRCLNYRWRILKSNSFLGHPFTSKLRKDPAQDLGDVHAATSSRTRSFVLAAFTRLAFEIEASGCNFHRHRVVRMHDGKDRRDA